MASQLLLDRISSAPTFNPPYRSFDTIAGPLEHFSENLRYTREYIERTTLPDSRSDEVTSMAPVNTIVEYTHVISLATAIQTQFTSDAKQKEASASRQESSGESSVRHVRRPENETFLLTQSNLEYIGVIPDYLDAQGKDNPHFTIYGTIVHDPPSELIRRHISMVFAWKEDVLLRINKHLAQIHHAAWDLTPYKSLDPTLYGLHAYQLIAAFFFNRVQTGKVAILNITTTIGYSPILTGADVARLIRDIHIYAFMLHVMTDNEDSTLSKSDRGFITQAVDGLQRSAHLLPEHIRPVFTRSLHLFADRIKKKEPIRSSALLINIAALLQPSIERTPPPPPPEQLDFAAMLSESQPVPEFRRQTNSVMQSLDGPAEAALVAQLRPRPFSSTTDRPRSQAASNGTRYDHRPDYVQRDQRRDTRTEYERREYRSETDRPRQVEHPSPALSLEEMQKSIATIQSHIDKQVRKVRNEEAAKSSRTHFGSAHMAAARTSSAPDIPPEDEMHHEHAFFALGATELPCHMDSDEYSD
jgi:hypothetical protein